MIEEAAQWAAILDAGEVSADDQGACAAWCAAHPLHQRTLDRMRRFDARVADADAFERDALRALLRRRRRAGGALLGLGVLVSLGWAAIAGGFVQDHFPDYRTARGEVRTLALEDGSAITLDTDGAFGVDMNDDLRQLRLIRGQLLASVAKDRDRPFVVVTAHGVATALGTRFTVRRERSYTLVTVIESQVRVCPARADEQACRILAPGERARVTPSEVTMETAIDPSAAGLWASGWLEADEQDASKVLAELSRYCERPIRFEAAALRGVKVTGSFPLRDMDRAIAGVARTAGLKVRRAADGAILVARRE